MNALWKRTTYSAIRNCMIRSEINIKPIHTAMVNINVQNTINPVICKTQAKIPHISIRYKSKKQKDFDSDDEQDTFDDDSSLKKDSKVIKFNTTSLRTDVVLKSALGVSRNKIEQVFYESKIRVNGKKIMKKSHSIKVGSELDVIKSVSPRNPDHLLVSRVEVLNLVPQEENILITVRRFKNLLIENYETDPYKASSGADTV